MDHPPRVGTFFALIGLGLLIMFVVTVMGNEINLVYLLLAIAAIFLGYIFRQRKPKSESGRFVSIRRANEISRKRRQEKMEKKNKK